MIELPYDGAPWATVFANTSAFPGLATCQFTGAEVLASVSPLECTAAWNLAMNCYPSSDDVDIKGLIGFKPIAEKQTVSLKQQNDTWQCHSYGAHMYFSTGKWKEDCNVTFQANISGRCLLVQGESGDSLDTLVV